ncbi:DnaJ domain-containing protein [Flavihumibacter fluvii]|uniref:DnaJ domain-containing protein n=1 Tax=Flavihumibacter fluvii TaxID=2838157 RepID=UPI001BDEB5A7|nr:DnaJ domain-containing protein [Flavihumibacter fluvii]ULQ53696.1 DnaJ domain-containing protein [Flavihumibacter fluvii]
MALKDYYELLEIPPGAPEPVIKKAFRKLAMRYHPDKNVGNPYAIHHFREIQEAYEVLSNPVTRNEYHQKRWLHPGLGKPFFSNYQVTPELIEKEAQKIARHVHNLDVFRMNYDALLIQLDQLLNENHLSLLHKEQDDKTNEKIILAIMQAIQPLPYPYLHDIPAKMVRLAGSNNQMILTIYRLASQKRKQYLWDKYKGLLMFLIALIICFIIYSIA